MNEILFSTDETGLLCFIHPTIEAVLGIPSADLAGRVLFTFRPGTLPPTQRLNFLAQTEETVRQQGLKDDAVAASELRYRRLFESAKDGILILDEKHEALRRHRGPSPSRRNRRPTG